VAIFTVEQIKESSGTGPFFIIAAALIKEKLIGYCVFEPASGDITQIAVDEEYRRKGIATNLLREVLNYNQHDAIKCINTDIECTSISRFLESISIDLKGKQFEMIKYL